ncbi:MFS transporter [Dactylosporangium roseum]|uniref:MFS transporter n=1 Tax=Dactylosporangium roseum TaxID=47989 RepID=A0ABY5YXU8_9ACTN|nr:MFS transporter [Dactylosporangium roseum]UWZ34219.1 MFS transporter [Dactylosporangium roseum]
MAAVVRAVALVLLCAFNLRTVLAAIGAAAAQVEQEMGAGGAVTGTVSAVSIVLIALGSPLALRLERRFDVAAVVGASLVLTALAQAVLLVPGAWSIWSAAALGGLGAGLLGTVLPAVVRALMPRHAGPGVAMIMLGSSAGFYLASLAVPQAVARTGSWRQAALVLGAVAVVAAVVWTLAARRGAPGPDTTERAGTEDREAGSAWSTLRAALGLPWLRLLTAFLAVQSMSVFAQIAWLVPTLVSRGVPAAQAGVLLGAFSAFQLVTGLGAPLLAQRFGRLGTLCAAAGCTLGLGALAMLTLPMSGSGGPGTLVTWATVIVLAFGHGASFALVNFAIADVSADARAAVGAGAAIMLVSQAAGASGPLLFGALRDASDGYAVPWLVLLLLAGIQTALGLGTRRALRRAEPSGGGGRTRALARSSPGPAA